MCAQAQIRFLLLLISFCFSDESSALDVNAAYSDLTPIRVSLFNSAPGTNLNCSFRTIQNSVAYIDTSIILSYSSYITIPVISKIIYFKVFRSSNKNLVVSSLNLSLPYDSSNSYLVSLLYSSGKQPYKIGVVPYKSTNAHIFYLNYPFNSLSTMLYIDKTFSFKLLSGQFYEISNRTLPTTRNTFKFCPNMTSSSSSSCLPLTATVRRICYQLT